MSVIKDRDAEVARTRAIVKRELAAGGLSDKLPEQDALLKCISTSARRAGPQAVRDEARIQVETFKENQRRVLWKQAPATVADVLSATFASPSANSWGQDPPRQVSPIIAQLASMLEAAENSHGLAQLDSTNVRPGDLGAAPGVFSNSTPPAFSPPPDIGHTPPAVWSELAMHVDLAGKYAGQALTTHPGARIAAAKELVKAALDPVRWAADLAPAATRPERGIEGRLPYDRER